MTEKKEHRPLICPHCQGLIPSPLVASYFGGLGGTSSRSEKKLRAVRRNLKKARKAKEAIRRRRRRYPPAFSPVTESLKPTVSGPPVTLPGWSGGLRFL